MLLSMHEDCGTEEQSVGSGIEQVRVSHLLPPKLGEIQLHAHVFGLNTPKFWQVKMVGQFE